MLYKIDSFILCGFQCVADIFAALVSPYRIAIACHVAGLLFFLCATFQCSGFMFWCFVFVLSLHAGSSSIIIPEYLANERRQGVIPARRYKDIFWRLWWFVCVALWALPPRTAFFAAEMAILAFLCRDYFAVCTWVKPIPKSFSKEVFA